MIDLRLGDCLDLFQELPSESIDLGFTSPPYYNAKPYSQYDSYSSYLEFLAEVTSQAYRVLKDGCIWVVNLSPIIQPREKRQSESTRFAIPFHYVGIAESVGFKFLEDIIWKKPLGSARGRGRGFHSHRQPVAYKPFSVTEYLLVFKKGNTLIDKVIRRHDKETRKKSKVVGEYEMSSVWEFNPEPSKHHPAPFPIALAKRVIEYYSFVGDTVLDCFAGIGTTLIAALKSGRNAIGFEINKSYYEIAKKRVAEAEPDGQMTLV